MPGTPRTSPTEPPPEPPDAKAVHSRERRRWVAEFLAWLGAELQLSPHTVAAYRRDVRAALSSTSAEEQRWPDRTAILRYLQGMRETHAPASVCRALAAIRAFFRFLHGEGVLRDDPTVGLLGERLEQKLPHTLSRKAVQAMLRTLTPGGPGDVGPLTQRNRAILQCLYASGCRVSEAVGLTLGSHLTDRGFLRVFGKGSRERLVPLTDAAADAIQTYTEHARPELLARAKRDPGDVLFLSRTGRPLDRQRISQIVQQAADDAGLVVTVSPHKLRHAFATHLVSSGADLRSVQEMLGHRSLATTQIYTHVDADRLRAVHRLHHPRGRSSSEGGPGGGASEGGTDPLPRAPAPSAPG